MQRRLDNDNIAEDVWKYWCRLCAKEDGKHINILSQHYQTSASADITYSTTAVDFIEEFFCINIKHDDLPKLLCTHCASLVSALVKFVDHVKQVQQMYDAIRVTEEWKLIDLRMLREKYNLVDGDKYTFQILHHDISSDKNTKSAIEKVYVSDMPDTVGKNSLNAIVKNEISTDEVQSEFISNEAEDKNEFYDPIGDIDTNNCSESESNDSEANITISKSLKVELFEKGVQKSNIRICKKDSANAVVVPQELKNRARACKKESYNSDHETLEHKYTCDECSIHFKQSGNYRAHMKKKHGVIEEPLKCPQCPKIFESRNKLHRHSKTHRPSEEKKIFPCPQCERKFQTKDYVTKHIKFVHEDLRPFICEECGEAVRTEATLKEHMLIHTDYAPFVCDICQKGFKNQYRLKSHKEIHSFNKYICTECGLQLNSRVTLNRHMLVHSDILRHKCEYCGRAFKRAKSLKSHLILHSGLKPYSCDFCDKTFANGANCRSHKRKSHPEELAALEASGGKTYTKNIPKLSVLKAVTRSAENLIPVVTKQSGNFSSGKRPKLSTEIPDITKSLKVQKQDDDASSQADETKEKVFISTETSSKEKRLGAGSLPTTFW